MFNVFNNNILLDKKIKLVDKLYIWSLIFEPLYFFFNASGGLSFGIPLSISRIFQFIVIFYYLFVGDEFKNYLENKKTLPFFISKYFGYFLIISFFSTFIGLYFFNSYESNIGSNYLTSLPFFKKPYIRALLEFFLLFYYYFYFVLISRIIFNSYNSLNYFLNYFFKVLYFVIIIGFIDYFLAFYQFDLISRHIGESTDVGTRWHSILGEPRDAFVYILFALLIYVTFIFLNNKKDYKVIFLLLVSLFLTQSLSGYIGLLLGVFIYVFYLLMKRKKIIFLSFFTLIILITFSVQLIQNSDRIMMYLDASNNLLYLLDSGIDLPPVMQFQAQNLFPLWEIYNDFIEFDLFHVLFGYGISTASIINFSYLGELGNPNAYFVKLIYEIGIIGTLFYVLFLIHPCLHFINYFYNKKKYILIFLLCLVIGSVLAHRSLISFIIVGLFMAMNKFKNKFKFNDEN